MSRNFLKRITVNSPCLSDWSSMTGNDQVRFCEHCNLEVHNLSEMTRSEATRLVAASQGRLCVRYYRDSQGAPLTRETPRRLHQIRRRASRIAAGTFGAAMSMSSAVVQSSPVAQPPVHSFQLHGASSLEEGGTVIGTIRDVQGAVIPYATVLLSSEDGGVAVHASTNDQGEFRFDGLATGIYNLKITAPGFSTLDLPGIFVEANREIRLDHTLSVAGIEEAVEIEGEVGTTMGVVAFVAPSDPFVKAAQEDNLETIQALIADSDVNLRDHRSGTTALEHAVGNANREMVQLLLSKGADVNARNSSGQTVLMMLSEQATSDLVWDLINAGAAVNLTDKQGNTALLTAAYGSNVEALKTLLDAGARVEMRNEQGQTALIVAAAGDRMLNVRALVLAGADINEKDKEGKTALTYATDNSHRAVIRFLRSRGAIEYVAQATDEEDDEK